MQSHKVLIVDVEFELKESIMWMPKASRVEQEAVIQEALRNIMETALSNLPDDGEFSSISGISGRDTAYLKIHGYSEAMDKDTLCSIVSDSIDQLANKEEIFKHVNARFSEEIQWF